MKLHRICRECNILHYENCETCFGFGVYSLKLGNAVHAGDAVDGTLKGIVIPCPECDSTEKGIPNKGIVRIFVVDRRGKREEVSDLYWFEENSVHGFDDEDGFTFEIFINDVKVYPVK